MVIIDSVAGRGESVSSVNVISVWRAKVNWFG